MSILAKDLGLGGLLSSQIRKVEEIIVSTLPQCGEVSAAALHLIQSGGKYMRAISVIVVSDALDFHDEKVFILAAALELLHNATLLHDDVVDNGSTRRKRITANFVWGDKISILAGDMLLAASMKLLASIGSIKVLEIVTEAAGEMVNGEEQQMMLRGSVISEEESLRIIDMKTSSLFSAAFFSTAVISDTSEEVAESFRCFGRLVGRSFQIIDDILDFQGKEENIGKGIGADFKEGKCTFPLSLLAKDLSVEDRDRLGKLLENPKGMDADFCFFKDLMLSCGIFDRCIIESRKFIDQGINMVSGTGIRSLELVYAFTKKIFERVD